MNNNNDSDDYDDKWNDSSQYIQYLLRASYMHLFILTVPNEETEKLNNLSKVINYSNDGVRIPIQTFCLWILSS